MMSALIGVALSAARLGWSCISGRRILPLLALLVIAVVMIGQLAWLVIGCRVTAGVLAMQRLWIARWFASRRSCAPGGYVGEPRSGLEYGCLRDRPRRGPDARCSTHHHSRGRQDPRALATPPRRHLGAR